jgi:hypothetical protein
MMPYDLQPPTARPPVPTCTPLRSPSWRPGSPWRIGARPRPSVCGSDPVPAGLVRLVLTEDYYLGVQWRVLGPKEHADTADVFDVPAGQCERWEAAAVAYAAVQAEAEEVIAGRAGRA